MASTSSNVNFSKSTDLILSAIRAVSYLKLHSHALEDSILRRIIVNIPACSVVTYCATCNDESIEKCLRALTRLNPSELQLVLNKSAQNGRISPLSCSSGKTNFKPFLDWKRRPPATSHSYNLMKTEVKEELTRKYGKSTPNVSKLTVKEAAFFNPVRGFPVAKSKSEYTSDITTLSHLRSNKKKNELSENAAIKIEEQKLGQPKIRNSTPVPQVKLNCKGEVIIDPESLKFPSPASSQSFAENPMEVHKERLARKCKTKWDFKDLVKFYRGLYLFGADFSLLSDFFPCRSRKNLKAKFKSEEKRNCNLVDRAVHSVNRSRADLAEIIRLLKVDRVLKSCGGLK